MIENLLANRNFLELIKYIPIDKITIKHINFSLEFMKKVAIEDFRAGGYSHLYYPSGELLKIIEKTLNSGDKVKTLEFFFKIIEFLLHFPIDFVNAGIEKRKNETKGTEINKWDIYTDRSYFMKIFEIINAKFRGFNVILNKCVERYPNEFSSKYFDLLYTYEQKADCGSLIRYSVERLLNDDPLSDRIKIFIDLINPFLLSLKHLPSLDLGVCIEKCLKSDSLLLKKIAIFVIGVNYEKFSYLFWRIDFNPLSILVLKPEIYRLISKNQNFMQKTEFDIYLNWIESINTPYKVNKIEDFVLRDKYYKRELLEPIKTRRFHRIKQMLKELEDIDISKIRHPGDWDVIGKVKFGFGKSPISNYKIEKMSIDSMIHSLNTFEEEENAWVMEKPTFSGLLQKFEQYIKKNHKKVLENLSKFCFLKKNILEHFLRSLQQDDFFSEIDEIVVFLNFIKNILAQQKIWAYNLDRDENSAQILSKILDMLSMFISMNFVQKSMPVLDEILAIIKIINEMIVKIDFSQSFKEGIDPPMQQIGRYYFLEQFYNLLFQLNHKYAFLGEKKHDLELNPQIEEILLFYLKKKECHSKELFYIIGAFHCLIDTFFLHKSELSFETIFDNANFENWYSAMRGHIHYDNYNPKYLVKMIQNGHYNEAYKKFSQDHEIRRLNCRLMVYFFEGKINSAKLKEVVKQILGIMTPDQFQSFIWVIWRYSKDWFKSNKKYQEVLLILLGEIIDFITTKDHISHRKEATIYLGMWIELFEEINIEILEYMKIILDLPISVMVNSLFEKFAEILPKFPKEIGELTLILVKRNDGIFLNKNLIDLIENLYINGLIETTNRICNLFFMKSDPTLKDLYKKYNSS